MSRVYKVHDLSGKPELWDAIKSCTPYIIGTGVQPAEGAERLFVYHVVHDNRRFTVVKPKGETSIIGCFYYHNHHSPFKVVEWYLNAIE